MVYNVTSFVDTQSFLGGVNDFTGGWFWSLMLLGLSIVFFIITVQRTTSDRAFLTAGMGSWLIGSFMFFLGWINWLVYFATILAFVGGVVATQIRGDNEV